MDGESIVYHDRPWLKSMNDRADARDATTMEQQDAR
jgi:hypothetical protein